MSGTERVRRTAARVAASAALAVLAAAGAPAGAGAHGVEDKAYRTVVERIEPAGLPVEVTPAKGDELRIENVGDKELTLCGYVLDSCEPYVRLGPDGVFVNTNSEAYYANQEQDDFGEVPKGVGKGAPKWELVRREPAFFTWHDHRAHWMGGKTLPPGVDASDPAVQKVNDWEVQLRYGTTDAVVQGRLDYVGGKGWFARYGEYGLMIAAIVAMLVVFAVDARRRRRDRPDGSGSGGESGGGGGPVAAADPETAGDEA